MKLDPDLQARNSLGSVPTMLARHRRIDANPTLEQEAFQAQELLFQARTCFPFVLFPDTLSIDRVKVTLTKRFFFGTSQVSSIQIGDVLNVIASTGPFFGSLKIWSRFFADRPLEVMYLSRADALAAEGILQGYIIAIHKNLDTSSIERDHLVKLLHQVGEESNTVD